MSFCHEGDTGTGDPQADRAQARRLSRAELEAIQLAKLNRLLCEVATRPFYGPRLRGIELPLASLDQLSQIPLLEKAELEPQRDPIVDFTSKGSNARDRGAWGRIFDLPRDRYVRFHQTSGTRGWPMPVLDTPDDWRWWIECWQYVLDAAHVTPQDIAMMAFSFGPFIGFWTAHDALIERHAMVIPGGGLSSEARLRLIDKHQCTVLCCTPTYAMHLARVAEELGIDLASGSISRIIVAGEPGGSIATIRDRIEEAWGATVVDHAGASEVGAWGFSECVRGKDDAPGIYVIETEFIAECLVIDAESGVARQAQEGEPSELVLTNLGRFGGPAIRYRTGDVVRGFREHDRACRFLWLDGGVVGRSDDMIVIRGVNIFPSSIESIVREMFPAEEFRVTVQCEQEMDQLTMEIESDATSAARLSDLLRERLGMRVPVTARAAGSLPRFEGKAKRWVDERPRDGAHPMNQDKADGEQAR